MIKELVNLLLFSIFIMNLVYTWVGGLVIWMAIENILNSFRYKTVFSRAFFARLSYYACVNTLFVRTYVRKYIRICSFYCLHSTKMVIVIHFTYEKKKSMSHVTDEVTTKDYFFLIFNKLNCLIRWDNDPFVNLNFIYTKKSLLLQFVF